MTNKTLDATNTSSSADDVKVEGNPDCWKLICKASSKKEGWMKSTKAMQIGLTKVLVQVTTQQGGNVSEALTLVDKCQLIPSDDAKSYYITTL